MWRYGDQIVKRFLKRGQVSWVIPGTIVEDTQERLSYYVGSGTPILKPVRTNGAPIDRSLTYSERQALPWKLGKGVWTSQSVLWTSCPGDASNVGMFYSEDFTEFRGWYINLEDPFRRLPAGLETSDHILDIRVESNGTWTWKDVDDFEESIQFGRFSLEEAAAVRAEGERMIAKIERAEWPFQAIWEDWRPDPAWTIPLLPAT